MSVNYSSSQVPINNDLKPEVALSKLSKRIRHQAGKAISDFNMIEDQDTIMVCLSGGKDSYTLLDTLLYFKKVAPISFSIVAVNLDQKQPGFPENVLPHYLDDLKKSQSFEYHIVNEDTYSIVKEKIPEGKTTCSLCSRLRRGILYKTATELGATKIALGHHRDDIIETFFLNLFHGGKLKAMPAKLQSDDGNHIVIRPLAYSSEKDIIRYAAQRRFPIIPCNLCGSQENLQRKHIKHMLQQWDKQSPGKVESIFTALQNSVTSHLLDRTLFDFIHLSENHNTGDIAFDPPEISNDTVKQAQSNTIEITRL